MSEAGTETAANEAEGAKTNGAPESAVEKKKPKRRPLFIAVPTDVDKLDIVDPDIPEPPEEDEDGKKPNVEITTMPSYYHMYVVPAGPGQKKAVNAILAKHNVDLRNIERVRVFPGDKAFDIEPQYNIRWK
jgi:hypothetical protein